MHRASLIKGPALSAVIEIPSGPNANQVESVARKLFIHTNVILSVRELDTIGLFKNIHFNMHHNFLKA